MIEDPMTPPAVELRRLTKTYREGDSERVVFRDVNATIRIGEIVVLVGRSGSGKSTLLNLISGIDQRHGLPRPRLSAWQRVLRRDGAIEASLLGRARRRLRAAQIVFRELGDHAHGSLLGPVRPIVAQGVAP
jgi:ABC-type glutathione transport system ATPase component